MGVGGEPAGPLGAGGGGVCGDGARGELLRWVLAAGVGESRVEARGRGRRRGARAEGVRRRLRLIPGLQAPEA